MRKTGPKILAYSLLTLLGVGAFSALANRGINARAAEYLDNVKTFESYPNEVSSGSMNED